MWGRPCAGAGWGFSDIVSYPNDYYNFQEPYCALVPSSQGAPMCTLFTYTYKVWMTEDDPPETTYLGWFPNEPESLDWAYSALVYWNASVPEPGDSGSSLRPFVLSAAPTPASSIVTIRLSVPAEEHVRLAVYDARGRRVVTLIDEKLDAGTHAIIWNRRNSGGQLVAPGVYLCRMDAGDCFIAEKVVLVDKRR